MRAAREYRRSVSRGRSSSRSQREAPILWEGFPRAEKKDDVCGRDLFKKIDEKGLFLSKSGVEDRIKSVGFSFVERDGKISNSKNEEIYSLFIRRQNLLAKKEELEDKIQTEENEQNDILEKFDKEKFDRTSLLSAEEEGLINAKTLLDETRKQFTYISERKKIYDEETRFYSMVEEKFRNDWSVLSDNSKQILSEIRARTVLLTRVLPPNPRPDAHEIARNIIQVFSDIDLMFRNGLSEETTREIDTVILNLQILPNFLIADNAEHRTLLEEKIFLYKVLRENLIKILSIYPEIIHSEERKKRAQSDSMNLAGELLSLQQREDEENLIVIDLEKKCAALRLPGTVEAELSAKNGRLKEKISSLLAAYDDIIDDLHLTEGREQTLFQDKD